MPKSDSAKLPSVCVAGKNNIAVDVLEYLIKQNGISEISVICNKTETGKNGFQKSLRWFANKHGIKEYTLEEVYSIDNLILLSTEFDRIVKPDKFKNARLYNIHFSLLPKYKGMFTAVLPLLNGDQKSGVTLHRIDAGIDTGEIIDQVSFPINGMDCRELYMKCLEIGTWVVTRNVSSILAGNEDARPQEIIGSTYNSRKRINYNNLTIDLNQTANGIANQIRAYCFREYQLPQINGHPIIDYHFTDTKSILKPGNVFWEADDMCIIATIDYNLVLYYDKFKDLMDSCRKGDLNTIRKICQVKKHIDSSDDKGYTPLMAAAYSGQTAVVEYLLLQGANVNAVDHNGRTPLMYAKNTYAKTGDSTIFSMLLKFGADAKLKDYEGKSLIDYCIEEGIKTIGDYNLVS